MQFRDRLTIRLADPSTRGVVFDQAALNQILDAGYDTEATPVGEPFSAIFDEFHLGYTELASTRGEGLLYGHTGELGRLAFTVSDWQPDQAPQADAFWRGAIIAHSVPEEARIEAVTLQWTAMGAIDPAVAAANGGALPADPATLETARRHALGEQLKQQLQSPEAVTDERLAHLLDGLGVATVGELLAVGTGHPAALGVHFSPSAGLPASPQRYPIAAALLIRDQGFALTDLLLETQRLRVRLAAYGVEGPRPAKLPLRQPLLVVWVLPSATFDDDDWPGATGGMSPAARRAARRQQAGQWLAREGIGLAVVDN